MSMHKKPLTPLEEEGLRLHGLDIGTPSQLSDVFRRGIAWALSQAQSAPEPVQCEFHGSDKGSYETHSGAVPCRPEPVQGEAALGSEQILEIFERNGFRIELGVSFSARGQIAQLLNAVGEIERTAAAKPDAELVRQADE